MGAAINPYPQLPKEGEGAAGSRDIENVRQVHKKSPEDFRSFCKTLIFNILPAVRTGLEPATPGVTGRYSNQTELPHRIFPERSCKDNHYFDTGKANLILFEKYVRDKFKNAWQYQWLKCYKQSEAACR